MMLPCVSDAPLGSSEDRGDWSFSESQQGSLQSVLLGALGQLCHGLDNHTSWAAVQEMRAFVCGLDQAVASAAPYHVQELIYSCECELSKVGPTSATLTLQGAYKVTTSLAMLLSQLDHLFKQQQQSTPLAGPMQLLQQMLVSSQQMLVSSLAKDLKRLLQELQTIRKREPLMKETLNSQSAAVLVELPSQLSLQDRPQQCHSLCQKPKGNSKMTPIAPAAAGSSTPQPSLAHGPQKAAAQAALPPSLPWAAPSTPGAPAAGAALDPFNQRVSFPQQQEAKLHQQQSLTPQPQQQQQPFCDFSEDYQMWDISGLREAAAAAALGWEGSSLVPPANIVGGVSKAPAAIAGTSVTNVESSVPVMPLNVVNAEDLIGTGLLGAGSFGSVYSGMWMGAPVAIKYLDRRSSSGSSVCQQLRKEVLLQAKCSHPNVVKFFAMCDDPPAIVMELCSGRSLAAGIREAAAASSPSSSTGSSRGLHQLLQSQTRVELLRQAASAVMCMHSQAGLLHNDLRADNMLLGSTAKGWVLKVADFGLAVELQPGASSASIRQPTNPLWLAPEVLQADRRHGCEVTKASDVYSLGCVMYECLTGKVPHGDESRNVDADVRAVQVGFAASMGEPVQLQYPSRDQMVLCPETGYQHGEVLRPLFDRCCSHQPDQRPTVQELHQRLQMISSGAHAS